MHQICIIHKTLVSLKITRILKLFLRSIVDFYFFLKKFFFLQHIMMGSSRPEDDENIEENIIRDVRNLFVLE